jgi:hypothetical protein
MKISPRQFRERYNIPLSTESKMRAEGKIPYEKVGRFIIYDQDTTDTLAQQGKLGRNALIAINNLLEQDTSEEHH